MKHRILSLITALVLCLSVCPVRAMAAEGAEDGVVQVVDSGEPETPALAKAGMMRVATSSGEINMEWDYFVFAQGVPIVIRQNGSITSIYGSDGTLLSGDTDVSDCAIYGGWFEGEYFADTSITMESGIVSYIYGGSNSGTLRGNTNIVVNGGIITAIYGGGYIGDVYGTTNITFGGNASAEYIYGGGFGGDVENTQVKIKGGQIVHTVYGGANCSDWAGNVTGTANITFENATAENIYGGRFQCYVENARVELKSGSCPSVYGGNCEGSSRWESTQNTTIILGVDWGSLATIYAGGYDSPTASSEIIIQNYKPESEQTCLVDIDASNAADSTVIVRRSESGPLGTANTSNFNLVPTNVKNIVAEYGEVTLLPRSGRYTDLKLDYLDIGADAHVAFSTWDSIEIGELSGSGGQLLLPAHFVSGTTDIVNTPISVDEISITGSLILKAEGTGWTTEKLENLAFFQGPGVNSLTSTDCFFAEGYDVVLRDLPDGSGKGVYLQLKEAETAVYISKLEFNQNPVTYNGTISLTIGVGKQLATVDCLELIPNARIQVRGNNPQDVLFADVQVNEDGTAATVTGADGITRDAAVNGGYITFTLSVNASLLDTCKEGLRMVATAPDQYSSTAQLVGPQGETEIEIAPASITLTKTIPTPAFLDPVKSGLENGAFYTASVLWHPDNNTTVNAFRVDCDYCADILLTPKEGHWLSEESIGNTVIYNGKEVACVFDDDGTATLQNLESVRFNGCVVTVAASPAEGGIVTGGGTYGPGVTVAVKADPAPGWRFAGWAENGSTVTKLSEYTFVASGRHTLTAVFEEEQTEVKSEVKVSSLTQVPAGLIGTSFDTVEKILAELRQRVQAAISGVGDNLVVYNVRLVYEDGTGVEPENFPAEGITAILPYPDGTNGTDYTFTVQHMISHGEDAGQVETLAYKALASGLECHFTSLSPVAIGYKAVEKNPPDDGGQPSGGGSGSSSDDRDDEYDFWQEVCKKIQNAKPGDTITVNARGYDKMSWTVMDALKKSDGVTLIIRWNGGEDIVIPSDKALSEALRIYYPLSYLASYPFGTAAPVMLNPETGGPFTAIGTPGTTNAQQRLTENGSGKAVVGAEGLDMTSPEAEPAPEERTISLPVIPFFLLAAVCGGVWVWKRYGSRFQR